MSDDKIQDATEPINPRRWLRSLTYEKVHAAIYGSFLMFVAAMAASAYVLAGFVAISLWALGVRSSPFRYTQSGDRKPAYRDEDLEEVVDDQDRADRIRDSGAAPQHIKPHQKIFTEIRHKPHYFLGGGAVGETAGRIVYYLTYGGQPDHWEQLPEIMAQLMFGVM